MADPKIDLVLDALGDFTRRRIVDRLSRGPATVSDLAGRLEITLTGVAQHLRILQQAQLVATEKIGRTRTCRLDTAGFDALANWARERRSRWDDRIDRLAAMFGPEGEEK